MLSMLTKFWKIHLSCHKIHDKCLFDEDGKVIGSRGRTLN